MKIWSHKDERGEEKGKKRGGKKKRKRKRKNCILKASTTLQYYCSMGVSKSLGTIFKVLKKNLKKLYSAFSQNYQHHSASKIK